MLPPSWRVGRVMDWERCFTRPPAGIVCVPRCVVSASELKTQATAWLTTLSVYCRCFGPGEHKPEMTKARPPVSWSGWFAVLGLGLPPLEVRGNSPCQRGVCRLSWGTEESPTSFARSHTVHARRVRDVLMSARLQMEIHYSFLLSHAS